MKYIETTSELEKFAEYLKYAELSILEEAGEFTVFATENAAYGEWEGPMMKLSSDRRQLSHFLKYHFVLGAWDTSSIEERLSTDGDFELTTLAGPNLRVRREGKLIFIYDEADRFVSLDGKGVNASNGILYSIEGVLVPLNGPQ
jgi:uncharacterized surface protein with fasciclin (FAS1) repeats